MNYGRRGIKKRQKAMNSPVTKIGKFCGVSLFTVQCEAPSWGQEWRKRRLKQNSFIDELTFMELPSVSQSGLKLQRRNSG